MKIIKTMILSILLVILIPVGINAQGLDVDTQTSNYGVNSYDKVYINDNGLMALSRGDILKIDGEYNGHYYTITKSKNIFFIPKSRISLLGEEYVRENSELIREKLAQQTKVTELIGFTYSQMGKPYLWGGNGTVAYDCSSLMQTAYKTIDVDIPRTSRTQGMHGRLINPSELTIGDLMFFKGSNGYISHVGMYIGEGLFIHASSSQNKVTTSSITENYYMKNIVAARRMLWWR